IRQFTLPTRPVLEGPADDLPSGEWITATRDNILRFSVVAYFFAKQLHEEYGIPIGIINASVGGTPIDSWTSEAGLQAFPDMLRTGTSNTGTARANGINRNAAQQRRAPAANRPPDQGLEGPLPWHDPAFKPAGWQTISIPGYWEDQGVQDLDGIVWYRREIDEPATMTDKTVRISLGRTLDANQEYVDDQPDANNTCKDQ